MPDYNADDDTFSIKMEIKYPDGTPFRVKVIEHDGCFYASDCGDTLKYLSSFNDRDITEIKKIRRYICLIRVMTRTILRSHIGEITYCI